MAAMFAFLTWAAPPLSAAPPPDKVTILPGIPNALNLVVVDINNQGQIVGNAFDNDFNLRNFLYDKGVYASIEFPGAVRNFTLVSGINDRGQIIGSSRCPSHLSPKHQQSGGNRRDLL